MNIDTDQTQEVVQRRPTEAEAGYSSANGDSKKYASVDDLLANAPKDIIERDVPDVFGGLTVKVRGLTAAQSAHVRQMSFNMQGRRPEVAWALMEVTQFELGVVQPKLTHEQALMLHRTAGPSFTRVIEVLDEISGTNKEELRKAQKEFQE